MKLRFYNAKILTMENENIIEGELCTDGGKITYVGAERTSGGYDREIDLSGDLIIPGFKDAHTHSAMTFLRSLADDLPLSDWLYKEVFPREAKLTEEAVYTHSAREYGVPHERYNFVFRYVHEASRLRQGL